MAPIGPIPDRSTEHEAGASRYNAKKSHAGGTSSLRLVCHRGAGLLNAGGDEILHFIYGHHFLAERIGTSFLRFHGTNHFGPILTAGGLQGCYYFLSHCSIT